MEINYFYEDIEEFSVDNKIQEKIILAIKEEKKELGSINYIFCSDIYLLNMNKEYLQHDYYTDIITFDYSENNIISGDIFISKDRVEDNAMQFKVGFLNELNRVMIHGVLHLLDYKDFTKEEKLEMKAKEDHYM